MVAALFYGFLGKVFRMERIIPEPERPQRAGLLRGAQADLQGLVIAALEAKGPDSFQGRFLHGIKYPAGVSFLSKRESSFL